MSFKSFDQQLIPRIEASWLTWKASFFDSETTSAEMTSAGKDDSLPIYASAAWAPQNLAQSFTMLQTARRAAQTHSIGRILPALERSYHKNVQPWLLVTDTLAERCREANLHCSINA